MTKSKLRNFMLVAGLTALVSFYTGYKIFHSLEKENNNLIEEEQTRIFYCGDLNRDGKNDQIVIGPDGIMKAYLKERKSGKYQEDKIYTQQIQGKTIEQIIKENRKTD